MNRTWYHSSSCCKYNRSEVVSHLKVKSHGAAVKMSVSVVQPCQGMEGAAWIQGDDPKQKKESQTRRDRSVPLEVPEKERQKGDLETMYGTSFVATWGAGNTEKEVGLGSGS